MINIPVGDFVIVLLIFLRIAAAFFASPIYSHKSIPNLVKVFLALLIAYIIFLTINKSTIVVEFTLGWLFANAVKEIITGLILGYMLNFVFYGIQFAGSIIGLNMELSMAETLNPIDGTSTNEIGQVLFMAALLLFFLINGHHYIISALVYSFSIVHLGVFTINESVYHLLIKYSADVFIIAVKIASPIMVSYFLIYLAEGIIAKVIPQMQVFFVVQPLVVGLGFILLVALAPVYLYVIKYLLKGYEDNLMSIMRAMGQ